MRARLAALWGWLRARWRWSVGILVAVLLVVGLGFGGLAGVRYVRHLQRDIAQQVVDARAAAAVAQDALALADAASESARLFAVEALRAADEASASAAAASASALAAAQAQPPGTTVAQATSSTPVASGSATTPASGSTVATATGSAPTSQVGGAKPVVVPAPGKATQVAKPVGSHPLTLVEARGLVNETFARIRSEQQRVSTRPAARKRTPAAAAPATIRPDYSAKWEYADGL